MLLHNKQAGLSGLEFISYKTNPTMTIHLISFMSGCKTSVVYRPIDRENFTKWSKL